MKDKEQKYEILTPEIYKELRIGYISDKNFRDDDVIYKDMHTSVFIKNGKYGYEGKDFSEPLRDMTLSEFIEICNDFYIMLPELQKIRLGIDAWLSDARLKYRFRDRNRI